MNHASWKLCSHASASREGPRFSAPSPLQRPTCPDACKFAVRGEYTSLRGSIFCPRGLLRNACIGLFVLVPRRRCRPRSQSPRAREPHWRSRAPSAAPAKAIALAYSQPPAQTRYPPCCVSTAGPDSAAATVTRIGSPRLTVLLPRLNRFLPAPLHPHPAATIHPAPNPKTRLTENDKSRSSLTERAWSQSIRNQLIGYFSRARTYE